MPQGYQISNDSFPQQFQGSQFPSYLPTQAPIGSLRNARSQLPGLFDAGAFNKANNAYIDSNFANQSQVAATQGRAASNRAMLSGGRFGAGFAQASAMLPLYGQRNQQAAEGARFTAGMNAQRAGILAGLAGNISQAQLQNRGMLSQYGLGQQRLAQDNSQFNQQMNLQRDQFDWQKQQGMQDQRSRSAYRQLQFLQPDGPTSAFDPYALNDNVMAQQNAANYAQRRNQLAGYL